MKLIILILSGLSSLSIGSIDLSYGSRGRTYPMVGAELFLESGYNYQFYKKNKIISGLIRPNLTIQSSVVVNQASAGLSVYPISFFGIHYHQKYIRSDIDFDFFDCEKVACQDDSTRGIFKTNLALAYKGFFLLTQFGYEKIKHSNKTLPIGEFRRFFVGAVERDNQREARFVFGRKISEDFSLLYLHEYAKMLKSGQRSWFHLLLAVHKSSNKNTYSYGLGTMGSSIKGHGLIAVFEWKKDILTGLKLL